MERVKTAAGMGGERGGTLPRLDTAEEGWERKEGGGMGGGRGGTGYGGAGYGGAGAAGAGAGALGGGYGYEGQEVHLRETVWRRDGGPREKIPLTHLPTHHITTAGGGGRPGRKRPREVPEHHVRLLARLEGWAHLQQF
jgi:hypothetical protein